MKGEAWRWAICAAIVAAAHGLAWRALSTPNYAAESDAGSPVVTLELSPLAAAPAPPPDEPHAEALPTEAPAATPAEPPPVAARVEIAPETPPLAEASTADAVAPPKPADPDLPNPPIPTRRRRRPASSLRRAPPLRPARSPSHRRGSPTSPQRLTARRDAKRTHRPPRSIAGVRR